MCVKPEQNEMEREHIWDWIVAGEERGICQFIICFGDLEDRLETAHYRKVNQPLRRAPDIFPNPISLFFFFLLKIHWCIYFANILFKNLESVVKRIWHYTAWVHFWDCSITCLWDLCKLVTISLPEFYHL